MARKKRSGKRRPRGQEASPKESRTAEAATVGWLLSALTTLVCVLGTWTARWYFHTNPEMESVGILAGVLLFAAVVIGSVALILTPIVYRLRHARPPTPITVFAVAVGSISWIMLLVGLLS